MKRTGCAWVAVVWVAGVWHLRVGACFCTEVVSLSETSRPPRTEQEVRSASCGARAVSSWSLGMYGGGDRQEEHMFMYRRT